VNRDPKPGEFLAGIIMPAEIHGLLRQRVTQIDACDTAVNCLIAQARAESIVEALEVLRALEASAIERLYLMISETARKRLDTLGADN